MAVAATAPGPGAAFKPLQRTRTSRSALLAAAAAASWVCHASPALAQGAPRVRIITGNGDFLVDMRPAAADSIVPGAAQQPAAAEEQTSAVTAVAPPTPLATAPISVPASALVQEAVISAASATEPALSAAAPPQDTPATSGPPEPVAVAAGENVTPPASTAPGTETAAEAVRAAVQTWAGAWAGKDLNTYFASYGQGFAPAGNQARESWETSRRARITGKPRISVTLSDLTIAVRGGLATARFKQHYSAGALNISSRKMLELAQEANERWVIVREATGP